MECATGFGASNEVVQSGTGDELLYYDTQSKYKNATTVVYGLFPPDADDPNYLHVRVAPTASASITVSDIPNHYPGLNLEVFLNVGVRTFVSTRGGQIIHPKVTITSPRVKGLTYDSTNHRQNADFSVRVDPPSGTNPSSTFSYQWSDPSGNLQFDNPHAQYTTAHATAPGKYNPTCLLIVSNSSGQFYGNDSAECAAIGGPINVKLDSVQRNNYAHDKNDPTQPWYLTYLGYKHQNNLGPDGFPKTPSTITQPTQNAKLRTLAQPAGTTVTFDDIPNTFAVRFDEVSGLIDTGGGQNWDDPPADDSGDATGPTTNFQELLYAEEAFKNAVPRAHFTFNDGVIASDPNVDIIDDSANTMDEVLNNNQPTGTFAPHV